ncbi:hypothetical protein V8F20_012462 [Naviculisporaceae sp. PSN 640]
MTSATPTQTINTSSASPPSDQTNSPDRDLSKDLMTSPTSPSSEHRASDAQRAMSSMDAWKPSFNRRQSWSQQEYKHHIQMSKVGHDQPDSGFTERA